MKKNSFPTLWIVLLFILFSTTGFSQQSSLPADASDYPYWIEMMQDPDANYYETVEAFNLYWADRPDRKGSGYKPFKRWEYFMQFKINPDGSKRVRGEDRTEYMNYIATHNSNREFEGDWVNLGPIHLPSTPNVFWGNGRLNAIAFHPTNPDIIYVGAPSGGLWVTYDGGANWEILTDNQPTLGVSSIIVDYSDPDVMYIGSGDRDAGDAEGLGVFKSTDAGSSWTQISGAMGDVTVGRMIQHPVNPGWIYAATSGGIYKSILGGDNWMMKRAGNFKEIVFKPGNPATLYASASGNFYKSADDGDTWTLITSGLPGGAYRGVIAVSDVNPEYVYFLASTSQAFYGLYRSTNSGLAFTLMSNSPNILGWNCNGGSGGQAWYDLDITADPLNADVIYAGGINCWKSTDGGANWFMVSNQTGQCGAWPVHADLHVLEWSPLNGKLYAGNDGGIFWTDDDGDTWENITDGLAIGQQYKLGQSKLISYHTITGYQDQGISTHHGDEWIQSDMYADGMEAAMDNTDTSLSYGCMQYGRMYRIIDDKADDAIAGEGINGIDESGDWVTPFTQHELEQDIMFIGYRNIWRTENLTDQNPSWENISGGIGGTSTVAVVEHSPADPDIFYFARSNNHVFRSDNIQAADPGFVEITAFLPNSGTPRDLEAHPTDRETVYMTLNRHVYKSGDKGQTWEDITGTLPDVSINDIAYYDRGPHDALYVGTNVGVFFRDNTKSDWVLFSGGLPAAILVTEIEIFHHPEDVTQDMIKAASYGRGLWESPPYYSTPGADFIASDTTPSAGCTIDFTDLSSGYPNNWEWTFDGGIPNTSTAANPSGIKYDSPGTYYVKLLVSNPDGSDSLMKTAYIKVGEATEPEADFIASDTLICPSAPVTLTDLSDNCPTAWEWSFDPATVNFLEGTGPQSQHPVVEFVDPEIYSVTLIASNTTGSDTLTKVDYIQAEGYPLPYSEDFTEPLLGPMEWSTVNNDGSYTWEIYYIEWQDNFAMKMQNFGYFYTGERDQLISPPINLMGYSGVFLDFDYAYAQRFSEIDSLIVYISDDCGTSWTRVWAGGPDGTGSFATSPNTGYPFEPATEEDWCGLGYGAECVSISLEEWIESGTIRVMFENYNGFGNNIYIDNVEVDFASDLNEISSSSGKFQVFPNPNNGEFTIHMDSDIGNGVINVYDLTGREVFSKNIKKSDREVKMNLDGAGKGIFFVEMRANQMLEVVKIVVQ
jgi:PKD repeat protein